MNTRTTLAMASIAGLATAAPAQETFIVSYSWVEVFSGTITPVPAANSNLEPGEAARIRVNVEARIGGTSAIGQTTAYTVPAPGGIGTVRGLGSAVYDLVGNNNTASANGTWGGFIGGLQGPTLNLPMNAGLSAGTPQPGGASVHGVGGAQFVLPGGSASGINSNVQVFRGVWQPASYFSRFVTFVARASVLVPTGEHNSLLLAYGLGTDPSTGENFDLITGKFVSTDFGAGVTVPVAIPAPPVAALMCLGAAVVGRRRRSDAL